MLVRRFTTHYSPLITSPKSQCGAWIKSPHCIRSRTALSLSSQRIAFFRSALTVHNSLLKNCRICVIGVPSSSICQKIRKEDFGQRGQKMQILNIHIIRQILKNENVIENKRKKDLSVSRVLLKSFLRNT